MTENEKQKLQKVQLEGEGGKKERKTQEENAEEEAEGGGGGNLDKTGIFS